MFCNQCRTELQPDYNVCPKCGTPVGRPTQPLAVSARAGWSAICARSAFFGLWSALSS